MDVLAIGAHPDDLEFGCFGTLHRHKRLGNRIHELVLTNGELGGSPQVRKSETLEAAKLLDATVTFVDLRDGMVRDDHATVGVIENEIRTYRAEVAYIPPSADRHQDHRNASLASISATREVEEVYAYETPSVLNTFSPQFFVNIRDDIEIKIAALRLHLSQQGRAYNTDEAARRLAEYRAYQAKPIHTYPEKPGGQRRRTKLSASSRSEPQIEQTAERRLGPCWFQRPRFTRRMFIAEEVSHSQH